MVLGTFHGFSWVSWIFRGLHGVLRSFSNAECFKGFRANFRGFQGHIREVRIVLKGFSWISTRFEGVSGIFQLVSSSLRAIVSCIW